MELEPTTFAVADALEYGLSLVRERAAAARHRARARASPTTWTMVEADELRFKQVVLNLLSNAVKFTPDGGRVARRAPRSRPTSCWSRSPTPGSASPPRTGSASSSRSSRAAAASAREEGTGLGLTLSPAHRGAVRRAALAGERGRARQHVRLRASRCRAGRTRPDATEPADRDRPTGRCWSRTTALARPADAPTSRSRGCEVVQRPRRRRGARARRGGCVPLRWCSTSGCPAWTAGRC